MTRRFLLEAILALFFGLLSDSATSEPVIFVIAGEDDWAPYSSSDADGAPKGYAVEIVKAALKSQDANFRLVSLPFSRCMESASHGHVDACFNATITSGNRTEFHWNKTALFYEELSIFGPRENDETGLSNADLKGSTVGITLGYTYPTELIMDKDINFIEVSSDDQLLKMLSLDRVDYILINELPAYVRMETLGPEYSKVRKVGTVSLDGFWLASTKRNPRGEELSTLFEKGLTRIKETGEYSALRQSLFVRFSQFRSE